MAPSRFGPGWRLPAARILVIGAVGLAALAAQAVRASDGGASFYLLGSGGPGAALLPPIRGIFFNNEAYFYSGKGGGSKNFVVSGNLVAGLHADIVADFPTLLWVPTTDFAGGTLALGGALPLGNPVVDVDAVLTGPRGRPVTITRHDSAIVVGDPVASVAVGWTVGRNMHLQLASLTNVPIGKYREGELANLAFHRWAEDLSLAASWHDPKAGWDVSAKAGFTFNGTNSYSDYKTGTEFHLEGAVEKLFSPTFSAGMQIYHFQQVSGDSGSGAVLGPNKGRVTGIGATAAHTVVVGRTPWTFRGQLFEEFDAKNRLSGTAAALTLTVPLVMHPPAAAAE